VSVCACACVRVRACLLAIALAFVLPVSAHIEDRVGACALRGALALVCVLVHAILLAPDVLMLALMLKCCCLRVELMAIFLKDALYSHAHFFARSIDAES
jgi:hypothetical protein